MIINNSSSCDLLDNSHLLAGLTSQGVCQSIASWLAEDYETIRSLSLLSHTARRCVGPADVKISIDAACHSIATDWAKYCNALDTGTQQLRRVGSYRKWKVAADVAASCKAWGLSTSTHREVTKCILSNAPSFRDKLAGWSESASSGGFEVACLAAREMREEMMADEQAMEAARMAAMPYDVCDAMECNKGQGYKGLDLHTCRYQEGCTNQVHHACSLGYLCAAHLACGSEGTGIGCDNLAQGDQEVVQGDDSGVAVGEQMQDVPCDHLEAAVGEQPTDGSHDRSHDGSEVAVEGQVQDAHQALKMAARIHGEELKVASRLLALVPPESYALADFEAHSVSFHGTVLFLQRKGEEPLKCAGGLVYDGKLEVPKDGGPGGVQCCLFGRALVTRGGDQASEEDSLVVMGVYVKKPSCHMTWMLHIPTSTAFKGKAASHPHLINPTTGAMRSVCCCSLTLVCCCSLTLVCCCSLTLVCCSLTL